MADEAQRPAAQGDAKGDGDAPRVDPSVAPGVGAGGAVTMAPPGPSTTNTEEHSTAIARAAEARASRAGAAAGTGGGGGSGGGDALVRPAVIYSTRCYALVVGTEMTGWTHLQRVPANLPKPRGGFDPPTVRECPRHMSEWKPKAKRDRNGRRKASIPSYWYPNWTLCWVDLHEQTNEVLMALKPNQKVNKMPGLFEMVRKKKLGINLNMIADLFPEAYDIFPRTWVLPQQWASLSRVANELKRKGRAPTLIVKPISSARGNGIFMTNDLNKISLTEQMVCQTYIQDPYLVHGIKFDMRVYALVTSCAPLRVFVYREGIARFATRKYERATADNMDALYMHLTNYSINKKNKAFVYAEESAGRGVGPGSKWTLSRLFRYFRDERGIDVDALWEAVRDCVVKTFLAVAPRLKVQYDKFYPLDYSGGLCFELVGFDIMLDSQLHPYVLEVNRNPSLNLDTPMDKAMKPQLIADTLRLVNPYRVDPNPRYKTFKNPRSILSDVARPADGKDPLAGLGVPLHPRQFASWEAIRDVSRRAFKRNPKEYKAWQRKRGAHARRVREGAEDAIVGITGYEMVYPVPDTQQPLAPVDDGKAAPSKKLQGEAVGGGGGGDVPGGAATGTDTTTAANAAGAGATAAGGWREAQTAKMAAYADIMAKSKTMWSAVEKAGGAQPKTAGGKPSSR